MATKFTGPLFIYGAPRSGTTYANRLVNSIEQVRLLYETSLIRTGAELFEDPTALENRDEFQAAIDHMRHVESAAGYDPTSITNRAPEFFDDLYREFATHRDYGAFCQRLFSADVPEGYIWGNKIVTFTEFPLVQVLFPQARFLLLIRDVRAVAASAKKFFGADPALTAMTWAKSVQQIRDFENKVDRQPSLMFLYEDFVRDARGALSQICDMVECPMPANAQQADVAHQQSLDKWKDSLSKSDLLRIEQVAFNEMKAYQYEPLHAQQACELSKLGLWLAYARHFIYRLRVSSPLHLLSAQRIKEFLTRYSELNRAKG